MNERKIEEKKLQEVNAMFVKIKRDVEVYVKNNLKKPVKVAKTANIFR